MTLEAFGPHLIERGDDGLEPLANGIAQFGESRPLSLGIDRASQAM